MPDNKIPHEFRERMHIESFRGAYRGFPSGVLQQAKKGQKPDFIVTINPKYNLGIEHTQFFRGIGNRGSPLKTQESLQEKVVRKAVEVYERKRLPPLIVSLFWAPYDRILRARMDAVAAGIADAVASHLPPSNLDQVQIEQTGLAGSPLPKEVNNIHIYRFDELPGNRWSSVRGDYVPEVGAINLQRIIEKKERKLPEYRQRCSAVWLLVVAEGLGPSSFGDIDKAVREERFVSSFDEVFFFKFFDKEVTRLSLVRRDRTSPEQRGTDHC